MEGIFGFGWWDTGAKLLTFAIIGILVKFEIMYLDKKCVKCVEEEQ